MTCHNALIGVCCGAMHQAQTDLRDAWHLRPRLISVALTLLRNRDDAEDIVQDVFLRLLQGQCLSQLKHQAALYSFLRTAVRNKAIELLRGRSRQTAYLEGERFPLAPASSPEQAYNAHLDFAVLLTQQANRLDRALLELKLSGLTYAEIADSVGGNPVYLRKRYQLLRQTLKCLET